MKTPIVVDIETIPAQLSQAQIESIRKSIKAPSNYKDPEKIKAYIEEAEQPLIAKQKFKIGGCQVVSIAMVVPNRSEAVELSDVEGLCSDDPEALAKFFTEYVNSFGRDYQLVGYNLRGFDLPILAHLLFTTGSYLNNPLGKWDVVDIWDNPLGKEYKLKDAAKRFGIEAAVEGDGSMVSELWETGARDAILLYNRSDVYITARLYQALSTIYSL